MAYVRQSRTGRTPAGYERAYIDAQLGVYEMNRPELLRDLFIWAYERSANEYNAVRKSLADPDPLRLRYRKEMHELIDDIVRNCRLDAEAVINSYADRRLAQAERLAFVEMVEKEISRLHMGIIEMLRDLVGPRILMTFCPPFGIVGKVFCLFFRPMLHAGCPNLLYT
ncbi:hypothetical protein KKHLCK_17060 [Candidatus Electrothrix laxa]